MTNLINITNKDGDLIVSSREVANNFEKNHQHILRDIKEYISHRPNLDSEFFIESEYINSRGQKYPQYLLTRDGFTLLAMGFTGKQALEWKLKYIEAFNKMEKAIQEVYHISETAIVNNIMGELENKIFTSIDERLAKYEENYRPTHANKININKYIKDALGDLTDNQDVELVKQRILISLNAEAWQDVPYEKLSKSMHLVDESIKAVKSFSNKKQLNLFES